ncbi:MAG: hypothetical protein KAU20_04640 [Nanoarchaeota archaeon]|nr:hypothetical protein [Nanoarchaeota archaeon]
MEQEPQLKELAEFYKTNLSTLTRLKGDYQIDFVGLENVLEARENFVFAKKIETKETKNKETKTKDTDSYHTCFTTLSLNVLCEAYMSLGKDPETFEDFMNKFDAYKPRLVSKLRTNISARSLPDSLLRFALEIYRRGPEEFEYL